MARNYPSFYAAVYAIADYHATNDDTEKEIPPKLGVWALCMFTGWKDKPTRDPKGREMLSYRDMAIIECMIVLVELETPKWSARQAAILISEIFGKIPENDDGSRLTIDPSSKHVEGIWQTAKHNRDKLETEYGRFLKFHSDERAKRVYQAWKKDGYPIVVAST